MADNFNIKELQAQHIVRLQKAKNNYNGLINYYEKKHFEFLNKYIEGTGKGEKQALEILDKVVFDPLETQNKQIQQKRAEELFSKTIDCLYENVTEENTSQLKELANNFQELKTRKELRATKEFQELVNTILDKEKIEKVVSEFLKIHYKNLDIATYDSSAFVNQLLGFRNNILSSLATGTMQGGSFNGLEDAKVITNSQSVQAVKGYSNEAAVEDAFSQLANYLQNNFKLEVKHTGADLTSGTMPDIDSVLKLIVPPSFSVTGKAEIETVRVQAKSWVVPWDKEFSSQSVSDYRLSEKVNLLNALNHSQRHSWTLAVLALSDLNNAIQATDNALLWQTGHGLYWADTLIRGMVNSGKYIAFKWNNASYEATSTLRWSAFQKNYKWAKES